MLLYMYHCCKCKATTYLSLQIVMWTEATFGTFNSPTSWGQIFLGSAGPIHMTIMGLVCRWKASWKGWQIAQDIWHIPPTFTLNFQQLGHHTPWGLIHCSTVLHCLQRRILSQLSPFLLSQARLPSFNWFKKTCNSIHVVKELENFCFSINFQNCLVRSKIFWDYLDHILSS